MEKKTDSVAKFNQVANGTQQPPEWGSGQWIKKIEDFTCKFLEYLFAVSKPNGRNEQDINDLLAEITNVGKQLDENRSAQFLPFIANLAFLKNQKLGNLDLTQAKQNVDAFRRTSLTTEYRQMDVDKQLAKLMEFVDGVRKLIEFIIQSAGGGNLKGASSVTSLMHVKSNSGIPGKSPSYLQANDPRNDRRGSNQSDRGNSGTRNAQSLKQTSQQTMITLNGQQQGSMNAQGPLLPKTASQLFNASPGDPIPVNEKIDTSMQTTTVGNNTYRCSIPDEVTQRYCKLKMQKQQGCDDYVNPHSKYKRRDPYPYKCAPKYCNDTNWTPMFIQGQTVTATQEMNNFPSVTQFQNVRELNIPGARLFNSPLTCKPRCRKTPAYKPLCPLNPFVRKPPTHTGYANPAWNAYQRPPGFGGRGANNCSYNPAPPQMYQDNCINPPQKRDFPSQLPAPPPSMDPVNSLAQAIRRSIQSSIVPSARKSSLPAEVDNIVQQVLASTEIRNLMHASLANVLGSFAQDSGPPPPPPPVMTSRSVQVIYDPTQDPDYVPPPVLASKHQQTNPSYSVAQFPPVDED